MEGEYAQVRRSGELLADPGVADPPHLSLGEVGLGAVHGNQRDPLRLDTPGQVHDHVVSGVTLAEMVLESGHSRRSWRRGCPGRSR